MIISKGLSKYNGKQLMRVIEKGVTDCHAAATSRGYSQGNMYSPLVSSWIQTRATNHGVLTQMA